jgi:hypothetical protein
LQENGRYTKQKAVFEHSLWTRRNKARSKCENSFMNSKENEISETNS